MNRIVFRFSKGEEKLVLDEPDFGVTEYSGIEATDYELEKSVNSNFIGERLKRKKVLSRPIEISADYLGSDELKSDKRQELIRFFSPFSSGTLTVNYLGVEREIEYEVESFQIESQNVCDMLEFKVELSCMDPIFQDIVQTGETISTWVKGWAWKFTLPFKLKERGEPKKNVFNSGHTEAPLEIYFHGPAVNPKIMNLSTGEFIRIKRELTSDDILYINTAFGQKKVEIIRGGVSTDAFDYIDLQSVFFSLQVGDNMLEYTSENGLDPQSVEVRYKNRYIGV